MCEYNTTNSNILLLEKNLFLSHVMFVTERKKFFTFCKKDKREKTQSTYYRRVFFSTQQTFIWQNIDRMNTYKHE